MIPEHTVKGGVHTLLWPEDNVRATVSRIREDSRYNVDADVLIKLAQSSKPHLHEARMRISGIGGRRQLANALRERVNSANWADIIETMCVLVIRQHREGEPPVRMSSIVAPAELRYQIYPILLQSQPTLIHGDGGSAKSTMAQYLSTLLDVGLDHCGLRVEPAKTLYLDWEADPIDFKQRITAIQKGLDVANEPDIWYRFCMQPLAGDIEAIQKIVAEHEIGALVVDSLGPACGGDLNDAQPIMALFDAVRTLKVTSLLIDHNNKAGVLYGNVYKTNRARLVWEARKAQEQGAPSLDLALFDRKRNRGMLQKPLGFHLEYTADTLSIARVDVADIPELASGLSLKQQITNVLRHGALTASQIAEEIESKDNIVRAILYRNKHLFIKTGDSWGILSNE